MWRIGELSGTTHRFAAEVAGQGRCEASERASARGFHLSNSCLPSAHQNFVPIPLRFRVTSTLWTFASFFPSLHRSVHIFVFLIANDQRHPFRLLIAISTVRLRLRIELVILLRCTILCRYYSRQLSLVFHCNVYFFSRVIFIKRFKNFILNDHLIALFCTYFSELFKN